jgi:hypothetical protein
MTEIIHFKLLPCSECYMLSSGWFTSVCSLNANPGNLFYISSRKAGNHLFHNSSISTIPWLTLLTTKQRCISHTSYIPIASMWVVALHSLFLCLDLPPPCHPPSDWLRLFFVPNLFPYNYPNILDPSHSSYLPAREDGTGRVFWNVGI